MDQHQRERLLSEYVSSQMAVLQASGLLAAVALGGQDWISGGPTDRLREELLSNLERFESMRVQLGDRLYPPPPRQVSEAVVALRALLEPWRPPEVSAALGEAAGQLVGLLVKSMFAPAEPPPLRDADRSSLDELGLPLPRHGLRTLYNASACALVVAAQPVATAGKIRGNRIFVRRLEEAMYREVVLPGDRLVAQSMIVCAAAPVAYVHTLCVSEDGSGADDGGLFRIGLPDGAVDTVPENSGGGWISALLGASADGKTLYVTAADVLAASSDGCAIAYGLASVDTITGEITPIAPLPGIFA